MRRILNYSLHSIAVRACLIYLGCWAALWAGIYYYFLGV